MRACDTDGDRTVDYYELHTLLNSRGGTAAVPSRFPGEARRQTVMASPVKSVATKQSLRVLLSELCLRRSETSRLLRQLDPTASGVVQRHELADALSSRLGIGQSIDEIVDALSGLVVNQQGMVRSDELLAMLVPERQAAWEHDEQVRTALRRLLVEFKKVEASQRNGASFPEGHMMRVQVCMRCVCAVVQCEAGGCGAMHAWV